MTTSDGAVDRVNWLLAMVTSGALWACFASDVRVLAALVVPGTVAACVRGPWQRALSPLRGRVLAWVLALLAGGTFAALSLRLQAVR